MTALKFKHIYCLTVLLVILALSNNLYADKERDAAEKSQISEAIHELSDTPTDQLLRLAKQVKAFLKGDLEGKPEISDLFDIDITNEDDVQLERTRLEILLKNKGSVTDPLLQARFALDEARLSFYALSQTQRLDLRERFKAQKEAQSKQALATRDQAQQQAAEAELLAQKALEDAQKARTEAERLVSEERARLMDVTAAQADFELTLVQNTELLQQRLERVLALKRQTSEVQSEQNMAAADAFYDDIRKTLKAARSDFADAMSASVAPSHIPKMEPSRLIQLAVDVDQSELKNLRKEIDSNTLRLRTIEKELRQKTSNQLYDEIHLLNTLRLNLIPDLSEEKRAAVTGLGLVAFEQAVAEFNHIMLELRFRLLTTQDWLRGEIISSTKATSLVAASFLILKWIFAIAVFIWWRRKGDSVVNSFIIQLQQQDRLNRNATPQPLVKILSFFLKVRGVLEWLVLVWWLEWIIPGSSIEIDLVTTALSWMLGGALVVNVINALSAEKDGVRLSGVALQTSELRLRSLRLVGRMVVIFGLSLALSSRLVGHGTIYNWVLKICWISVVPILFMIIHWWKPAIFIRIRSIRKKKSFENWIVEHERGWSSFPSAVAAGIYLFLRGSVRVVRYQIDQFELTRRALAYLFRRGLDRLANEDQNTPLMPLQPDLFKDLGPDVSSIETLQKPFESDLKDFLVDSKGQKTAGVFALVAERGAGKTTIIRHIASQNQNSITVDCPELGLGCLTRSLATQLHLLPDASIEECAQRAERDGTPKIILIDNAHRLIKPVMGGLADFDRLIAAARRNSRTCAWVLTLDDVIWRFFESGRGIRPLFDSVTKLSSWNENSIAELLQKRSQQVNLEPSFERLIEKLPADADEIDFAQAREKAATGYYRFLWDYSDGNPGVALQMWRQSLAVDHSGKVFVRYYSAPDTKELEKLPD